MPQMRTWVFRCSWWFMQIRISKYVVSRILQLLQLGRKMSTLWVWIYPPKKWAMFSQSSTILLLPSSILQGNVPNLLTWLYCWSRIQLSIKCKLHLLECFFSLSKLFFRKLLFIVYVWIWAYGWRLCPFVL